MLRLNRWIAAALAACLLINTLPVSAVAESEGSTSTEESTSEVIETPSEVSQVTQTPQEAEQKTTNQETEIQETQNQETQNTQSTQNTQKTLGENGIQLAAERSEDFVVSFENELSKLGYNNIITQDANGITLTIGEGQGEILELLSKQPQTQDSNYQDWSIKFNFTGELTLPSTFEGLGDWGDSLDQQIPFKGKFTGQTVTIKTSTTIFKALDASAELNDNKIVWEIGVNDATPTVPILTDVLVADGSEHTVNMPLASANRFNPYIGMLTGGTGEVTLSTLNYANVGTNPAVEYPGNQGLICCSMAVNTSLKVGAVTLPSVSLNLMSAQNVGSLVGSMGEGSKLTITEDLTLNSALNGANAGGLVGFMTNATIDVAEDKSVTVIAALTATGAAGGIAGEATTATGILGANANVILQSIKANGMQNSGVLYGRCTATGELNPLIGVSFVENAVREVSGSGFCGGLFGTLALNESGKCILGSTETPSIEISTSLTDAANTTSFGGVVGNLTGEKSSNALVINNCIITSNINVGNETTKYPAYLGGIVAKQETATLDAKDSTTKVYSPKTAKAANYGFGGVTAYLGDDTLLIADGIKVFTDSFLTNPGGGGVAGSTHKGSILYLKNSLNLIECPLSTNNTSGQIVGSQDCSLIYAPDVDIFRLKTDEYDGMELDDIGNYGELYRLSGFLTLDGNYGVHFSKKLEKTGDVYQLSDVQDYVCLALAWQSRGYFQTVAGVTKENWSILKSSNITLNADINLTNCGIGGLTRDVFSDNDTFSGEFNGENHKITLDIGAENQANSTKVSKGDGRIYWHNATGLFAVLSSTATIQELELAGKIRLSNNRLGTMYSGALAAQMNGNREGGSTLSQIKTNVTFDAKVSGANTLYLGGLIGQISSGTSRIDLGTGTSLASTINITHSGNGSSNHIGGAIGGIVGDASAYITCNGATISGSITSTNTINNLYAGGLIGTIWPATNSSIRNIELTNLKVDGFSLTGSASASMGGILGGIWADTDVMIGKLTVIDTKLIAKGAAELGGLVYRAGGKWTVSDVDLSGLTITARSSTKALGLLICHGEPHKESISSTSIGGLYLEMTQNWDTGYKVPTINGFGNNVFDEFVAYTAYRSADGSYDITHNGSGIISLKTQDSTVHMTEGERNTYINRTTVGQSKQTNSYSRYYYNLDSIKFDLDKSPGSIEIDNAKELLIWSVYRYAAANIQKYFTLNNANVSNNTIGGTASSHADFDMNGLSYYPINITDESVNVRYADIKFYNNEIEEKENGNKSTRGTAESHTQHYTMHCALFQNFSAEKATENKAHQLTVNGVSFAGTVGVVNGGSGALLCGTVEGKTDSGNTATCTVILADEDDDTKAISLNGISVEPEGEYTPVLINKFGSYAGLKANYITTTISQTSRAGSSLIGDVGSENATNVMIIFGGTIKLPEQKSGSGQVFTKATLLNSLRYADGSATYTFVSGKDEGTLHNTTHGYELSESVEYEGKCGFYDDDTDGTNKILSPNGQMDFKSYLPYVTHSPATDENAYPLSGKWHEIAVNIHSEPLTEGCGTYGHPYQVTAMELREAANYLNTGVASTGWQVRVPKDEAYHTDNSGDILLTYRNGVWEKEDGNAYTGDVRKHLQSAYYQLVYAKDENGNPETTVTLSNFPGIGTNPDWAFTGVITGKQTDDSNATIVLSGSSSSFIKYSYGSVVRDINFELNQNLSLTWMDPGRTVEGTTPAQQAPSTFFGGVIGCVLGGDNIIENVTVTKEGDFAVAAAGTNSHLVPVGGYIGVIAGGGVIFRGEISSVTGITGTDAQLYRNSIIGRVLGGFAFYEGSGVVLDNGNKNYQINTITTIGDHKDLKWNGSDLTLTVNNAQGLLILSAIVSSGAGSTESNAYSKGVARNAKYDCIGKTAGDASEDFGLAKSDKVGSTPYLLKQYAGCAERVDFCVNSANTNGVNVAFAEVPYFNMESYGNGYRGLSARYVSNAAFSESTVTPSVVVMRVKTFDGQNATVSGINMDVKEYNNDDFHAASIGGIFNIVWTQQQSGGGGVGSNFAQNLTLQNCNVKLQYVNSNGEKVNSAESSTFSDADGRLSVSVGGFIGMANDIAANNNSQKTTNHNYLFTNIRIEGTEIEGTMNKYQIYGPNGVGGLIGTTAMASEGVKGYPGKLLANGKWALFGPNFLDCSYSNIEVTAGLAAGGLIGDAYASGPTTVPGFSGLGISYGNKAFLCYASCTVTKENLIVGENSTIKARAKASIAGGIFGAAGMRVSVNDPQVGSADKSNLTINEPFQTLYLSDVKVLVSQENFPASSNPDSDAKYAYAGGIIARIGSENPVYFYDVDIQGGEVTSSLATESYVGGIVGSGYTNKANTMERCHINNLTVSGAYAGGFLGRGLSATGFILYMSDCSILNSTIKGSSYAGGVVGSAASYYYLYNLLIKNTSITANDSAKAGRLFGLMNFNAAGDDFKVYAAGVSVYADNPDVSVPQKEGYDGGKNYIGYIAYADYAGAETARDGQKPPYVTVNPNYTLAGDEHKLLTGDAVGKIQDDAYNSVAARIWADHQIGAADKKNLASYTKASEIVSGKTAPEVSTFREVQGYTNEEWSLDDLPVLVLKGNDASTIEDYLNVITNGGYERANVTPTVSVYYFDKDQKSFSKATQQQLATNPASIYYQNNQFNIQSRTFDNTLNRFSLVEVSFIVSINGVDRTYTVSVPVVVIRELQYDFMATFSYGKEFSKDIFSDLKTHLLESTGNPFTAYLTYQYNREKTQYVEYDWQTYMDDGGSMLDVDKVLKFSSGLPAGTQMILLDCQNGNQAYQYTTNGNSTIDVQLSDFTSLTDGAIKFQSSMADILGISQTEKVDGKYVKTTAADGTLRLDGEYYRLYNSETDSGKDRFELTVPDLSLKAPEENYYLVITVPNQSDPAYYINGSLSSELNWSMPSSGTQLHRYDNSKVDERNNTESTYQISTGYRQEIISTAESGAAIDLGDPNQKMQVKVQDTITFSNQQTYGDSDQLFLKLTVNLQEYTNSGSESEEKQFPVGTTGTVKFYVQDGTKTNYYKWNGIEWVSQESKTEAASYPWSSNGSNMELLLSEDGSSALDLAGVRQMIKGSQNTGDSAIIVTAEMDIEFGSSEVLNAAVPGSENAGADTWAQLHYLGQISAQEASLNYSAMRATKDDNAKYYRSVRYQAVLSMDAMQIDQLGVNPLQLVQDYQETVNGKNASRIDLTAALNLANLQNIESILQNTNSITFTLSLQRKEDDYIANVTNASEYIAFQWPDAQVQEWSWTVNQDQYYKDGKIVTNDIFDGTQFTIPIKAYVFTDQKGYANYKIKLSVSFENGSTVAVTDTDAYVIYTYACIKPEFYEPQSSGSTP